jgi:hypothetical protein
VLILGNCVQSAYLDLRLMKATMQSFQLLIARLAVRRQVTDRRFGLGLLFCGMASIAVVLFLCRLFIL